MKTNWFILMGATDNFDQLAEYANTLDIKDKDKQFFYLYLKDLHVFDELLVDVAINTKHIIFDVVNYNMDKKVTLDLDVKYIREIMK